MPASTPLDPLTCTIQQAAGATGLSQDFIRDLIRRGDLPALKIGGRVLISYAALRDLVGAQ